MKKCLFSFGKILLLVLLVVLNFCIAIYAVLNTNSANALMAETKHSCYVGRLSTSEDNPYDYWCGDCKKHYIKPTGDGHCDIGVDGQCDNLID